MVLGMYEDPEMYSSLSADYVRDTEEVMAKFWNRLPWGSSELVLDVGCGTGDCMVHAFLPALPPDFQALYGIDISPTMIEYANSKRKDRRIKFNVMDISTKKEPLSYFDDNIQKSGGFDKIFSFYCMQWVKDRRKALKNMYRLLRQGGILTINLVVRNGLYKIWDRLANSEKWRHYFKDVDLPFNEYVYMENCEEVFRQETRRAGFILDNCLPLPNRKIFSTDITSIQKVSERLRSIDPLVRLLHTEEQRQEYISELVDTVQREVGFERAFTYSGLLFVLRKPACRRLDRLIAA